MENQEAQEATISKLWRSSAPKHKRVPFKEFAEQYNRNKEKGEFKNLISTDQKVKVFDEGVTGSSAFAAQVAVTGEKDTFYSPMKDPPADNMIRTLMTDKGAEAVPETVAATEPVNVPAEPSLALFFVFGITVSVAGFIIYKKFK